MKHHNLGKASLRRLKTADDEFSLILPRALSVCPFDFGVAHLGTGRNFDEQYGLFIKGASKLNPYVEEDRLKAKHLLTEEYPKSRAVDVYAYIPNHPEAYFDELAICVIAGCILSVGEQMYQNGEVKYQLRWGGDWDRDSIPNKFDGHTFNDLGHIEQIR